MSSGEHSTVYCQVSPATKSLYLESSSSPERKYGRGKKSNNRKPDRQARPSRYPSRQSAKCSGYGRRAKSWSSPWSSPHPTTLLRPKNAEVKSKNTFLDKTHQWESNNEERKKKPRACRLQACPCFPNTDFQGLCSKHRLPSRTSQEPRYCASQGLCSKHRLPRALFQTQTSLEHFTGAQVLRLLLSVMSWRVYFRERMLGVPPGTRPLFLPLPALWDSTRLRVALTPTTHCSHLHVCVSVCVSVWIWECMR